MNPADPTLAGASPTLATSPAEVRTTTTPGGLEVWRVESDFVPLVALAFNFEGGAAQDPPGKAGALQMLARLLDEGAGPYDSDAFQEAMARDAIEIGFNAGPDALGGSLRTLADKTDRAFELLALALAEPRFDPDAVERVRAQTIAGLRYHANDPGTVASRRFFAEAFPDHPYGRPAGGTVESVSAITRDDLVALHRDVVERGHLKLVAVGSIGEAELGRQLDRTFASLPRQGHLAPVAATAITGLGRRVVAELDVPQSVIRFGVPGLSWRDPDFIPAYVLNHILGGGAFTSRLFQEVRERRGLAYGVGTSLVSYRQGAMTWGYTATKNERVAECLDVITDEMRKLSQDGPTDDELAKARDYLTGSYALGFDTSTKIAHQLAQIAFEDLGIDYIRRRNQLIAAVTPDDITRAAARTLGDASMLVVIAGQPHGMS